MLTQLRQNNSVAEDMTRLLAWADERFDRLPLLIEGESKVMRSAAPGLAIVRLKPTLYSITANRAGVVEGTDILRLRISEILWRILSRGGIQTTIRAVSERSYLTEYVNPPPIEIIVKACQLGTPKHIYHGISERKTRRGGRLEPGAIHEPYVRFDWRNPLPMRDECMPSWLADQFIDVKKAEATALKAFALLVAFMAERRLELLDICFMITEAGDTIYGEVSPDCMRVKSLGEDLDKDLWRKGKDAETIVKQWARFSLVGAQLSAVVFDWGNTLVDYPLANSAAQIEFLGSTLEQALDDCGCDPIPQRILPGVIATLNSERSDLKVTHFTSRLRSVLPGISMTESEMVEEYLCRRIFVQGQAFPDSWTTVEKLKARGLSVGIVSNLPWGTSEVLWKSEFRRHLGAIADRVPFVCCRDVGYRKPHPAPFERCMEILGCIPQKTLMVGDNIDSDMVGGTRAGMRCALIAMQAEREMPNVSQYCRLTDLADAILGD